MEVRLLGPVEVTDGPGRTVALPGRQKTLLALLALHAGHRVSADRLIDALWEDALPANPANALQGRISQLRRLVGRSTVQQHGPGYLLDLPVERVDTHQFERCCADGQRRMAQGDTTGGRAALARGLALWRGRALEDVIPVTWAIPEIHRLEERRLGALEARVDIDLALGAQDLVAELQELVDRHPLRERLRGQLMIALYRAGRQAEALDAYARGRELLANELGLEPGPDLQRVQAAVLSQEAELSPRQLAAPDRFAEHADASVGASTRVLLVDDDPLVRSAVRTILAATDDLDVVGEAADGQEAVEAAGRLGAEVVLMDVHMPGMDGIEATRQLGREPGGPAVLMLTTFEHDESVIQALEAGASGYVLKRSEPEKLADAVRIVARGDAIVDPGVTRSVLGAFIQRTGSP